MAANTQTTGAPGVTNDSSQGFAAGSTWRDVSTNALYICTDATVGAAVWSKVSAEPTAQSVWGDMATAVYDQRSRGVLQDIVLLLIEIRDLLRG